jgi:prevent-host-death family protein
LVQETAVKQPALSRDLVPINEFRANLKTWLARVGNGRSVVVTQRGKATAVLVSPELLDEAAEERRFMKAIVRALRDVDAGDLLDDDLVWNELDQLMKETEARREGPME